MIQKKIIRGPALLNEIHSSGRCIANLEGKKAYLDFGIPGETVEFVLKRNKQGFRAGQVTECITPSPHRVEPFCAHYGQCGGCNWQHIDYPFQLELKRRILYNALTKYAITTPTISPVIPSPEIRYFRHRMEYTFASYSDATYQPANPEPVLGFHKYENPGKIIDIHECHLQAEPSRSICDFVKTYALEHNLSFYNHETTTGLLRSLSIRTTSSGDALVVIGFAQDREPERESLLQRLKHEFPAIVSLCWTIHRSHTHGQLQGDIIPFGDTNRYMYKTLAGNRFRVDATSFFQPNARQAEQIFQTAHDWVHFSGHEKVYDLYTGIGTLALFMAPDARHVTGIEGSAIAIDDAKENARLNGMDNVEFITGDILETFKPDFLANHGKPDLIILDPPRSGTLIEIKKTINTSGADKILYLSCNPVSLAFDLKQLTEEYGITRIQPFDMLPHTHHLETLVLLEKK